ncbi:MAG: hypothetical protein APF81_09905 [Desulfosporosinus sp. BRH_c37]|nr:MAG: hypothetical protein APF81_09905 [Desulfosporosinus sp. BRH_c37]
MITIFLSHSSKDIKDFETILNNLKPLNDYCHIRCYRSAIEKNITMEKIIKSLPEVDLFVVFISDNSLSSANVQKELSEAIRLSKLGNLREICPIIIDITANSDSRIPEYIKKNIYYAASPIRAAQIIEENSRKLMC